MDRINTWARGTVYNWLFKGTGVKSASEVEIATEQTAALARRYYDGNHKVYLTDRAKAWLALHGDNVTFTVNHCPTVVDAVVERLKVTGFNLPASKEVSALVWSWWTANRMDAIQTEAHRAAIRDGEAFMLVSWNEIERRPEFTFHPRYTSTENGGDGYGMMIEYPSNDYLSQPLRAIKRWIDYGEDGQVHTRQTVYYADRIERQIFDGADWQPYIEEGQEAIQPFAMPDGSPLGIPVVHLRNPGAVSELKNIIPLQDALNKTWLDILAAGDTTAFRMLAFFGWIPTTDGLDPAADGSNVLKVAPGQMMGTLKSPAEAGVETIDPADLTPLLDSEERIVYRMASISRTPLAMFITTKQIAAEGTLKQQEGPLLAKIAERQTILGNAWEDLAKMALKLNAAYGGGSDDWRQQISTLWANPSTRDELQEIQIATQKKALGVTPDMYLAEIGYTQEQITQMKASPEWQARLAGMNLAVLTADSMGPGTMKMDPMKMDPMRKPNGG